MALLPLMATHWSIAKPFFGRALSRPPQYMPWERAWCQLALSCRNERRFSLRFKLGSCRQSLQATLSKRLSLCVARMQAHQC